MRRLPHISLEYLAGILTFNGILDNPTRLPLPPVLSSSISIQDQNPPIHSVLKPRIYPSFLFLLIYLHQTIQKFC